MLCLIDMPHARIHLGFPAEGSFGWDAVPGSFDLQRMSLWLAIVFGDLDMQSTKCSHVTNQYDFTLSR